jgi:hypothetical protein
MCKCTTRVSLAIRAMADDGAAVDARDGYGNGAAEAGGGFRDLWFGLLLLLLGRHGLIGWFGFCGKCSVIYGSWLRDILAVR